MCNLQTCKDNVVYVLVWIDVTYVPVLIDVAYKNVRIDVSYVLHG